MTLAEELRAAATKLRETAATAHPAPWRPEIDELGRGVDVRDGQDAHIAFGLTMADAGWLALVHPGLAEPLAAWLESAARKVDGNEYLPPRRHYDPAEALAIARVITGGAS